MKAFIFLIIMGLLVSCQRIDPECLLRDGHHCQVVSIKSGAHQSKMKRPGVCQDSISMVITFLTDLRYQGIDQNDSDFMDVSKVIGLVDAKGAREGKSYGPTQAVRLGWQNHIEGSGEHRIKAVLYVNHGSDHLIIPLLHEGIHLDIELDTPYKVSVIAAKSRYEVQIIDPTSGHTFSAKTVRYSKNKCHKLSAPWSGGQRTMSRDVRIEICSDEKWIECS